MKDLYGFRFNRNNAIFNDPNGQQVPPPQDTQTMPSAVAQQDTPTMPPEVVPHEIQTENLPYNDSHFNEHVVHSIEKQISKRNQLIDDTMTNQSPDYRLSRYVTDKYHSRTYWDQYREPLP